jgi:hypothetical protein
VFAKTSSSILSLGGPTAIGASFLFDVVERPDGGALQAYIGRSDGVAPVERFIAGSPQEWVGAPMFAHSHIGWQKGIGPKRVNEFEAVELWASTYAGDSAALTPYKVGDLPAKSWSWIGAGWGRYVTLGESAGTEPRELAVWDLEAKTNVSIVLPADRSFEACAGVTRSAVWVVPALVSSRQRGLLRFAL